MTIRLNSKLYYTVISPMVSALFRWFAPSLLFLMLFVCTQAEAAAKPYILVSIAPQKFFVKQIAGDTVNVNTIVPAGSSPHTYEPTPRQMIRASEAVIWFRIGEPFEKRSINVFRCHHPGMDIVDTRANLPLLSYGVRGHCPQCTNDD